VGKKEEPGRPILYGTTKEFLEFFNLRDLKDLPTLREFHELSDEHRAQVEALEAAAPEGTLETEEEAAAAAAQPSVLSRVDFKAPPEDSAELDEIDRLINTAHVPISDGDPKPEEK
jgi:segregation and condensation protein B